MDPSAYRGHSAEQDIPSRRPEHPRGSEKVVSSSQSQPPSIQARQTLRAPPKPAHTLDLLGLLLFQAHRRLHTGDITYWKAFASPKTKLNGFRWAGAGPAANPASARRRERPPSWLFAFRCSSGCKRSGVSRLRSGRVVREELSASSCDPADPAACELSTSPGRACMSMCNNPPSKRVKMGEIMEVEELHDSRGKAGNDGRIQLEVFGNRYLTLIILSNLGNPRDILSLAKTRKLFSKKEDRHGGERWSVAEEGARRHLVGLLRPKDATDTHSCLRRFRNESWMAVLYKYFIYQKRDIYFGLSLGRTARYAGEDNTTLVMQSEDGCGVAAVASNYVMQ
ncbi:hypothetical protein THAOC_31448, partial [Thalassiosira oceanica]